MAQVIARMFGSHDKALAAEKALRQKGLPANEISVLAGSAAATPSTPHQEPQVDSETQAVTEDWTPTEHAPQAPPEPAPAPASASASSEERLRRLGVPRDHIAAYAKGLSQGHALVVVRPPFGAAQTAINTLHEFDPMSVEGTEERLPEVVAHDRAAPLSAKLGWPVLLDSATPLSDALNWPVLKKEPADSKTSEQIRKMSANAAPLSDAVKLPLLSDNAAPLSSAVKFATLSDNPAPLSKAVGMKVLSDEPAPLSKKVGWRTLLNDPAPLSRLLGLPVLLKR